MGGMDPMYLSPEEAWSCRRRLLTRMKKQNQGQEPQEKKNTTQGRQPRMPPHKFASVRYRSRPAMLVAFRDDSSLVTLRYEHTVEAEPPIPIPPRNPLRSTPSCRPSSTVSSSTSSISATATTNSSTTATSITNTNTYRDTLTPVLVHPPLAHRRLSPSPPHTPSLPPPVEEHPALRNSLREQRDASLDRVASSRRDSGLAPTASSATIRTYSTDKDSIGEGDDLTLYDKPNHSSPKIPAPLPTELHSHDTPAALLNGTKKASDASDRKRRLQPPDDVHPTYLQLEFAPEQPGHNPVRAVDPSVAPPATPARRLVKSFSFRGTALPAKKLQKKKSLNAGSATISLHPATNTAQISPMAPLSKPRGSSSSYPPPTPNKNKPITPGSDPDFSPLSVAIPDDRLLEDDFMNNLSFSQRGSVMFGGRRAVSQSTMDSAPADMEGPASAITSATSPPSAPQLSTPASPTVGDGSTAVALNNTSETVADTTPPTSMATATTPKKTNPSIRLMPADVEKDSEKVRSLYEYGDVIRWEDGGRLSPLGERLEPNADPERPSEDLENDPVSELQHAWLATPRSVSSLSSRNDSLVRKEYELAGGVEDWEDVNGGDVDRYGFISPRKPESRVSTPTELKSAQLAPRRRNFLSKRDASGLSSYLGSGRSPSRKVSARSLNTQSSNVSERSRRSTRSAIRHASNYLPHNRNRRWMDEAGEMLTLAPGLRDIMEDAKVEKISEAIKRKEWERSEKWRKMARVVKKGKEGEGMVFEFDVKNPKLIERTWKGIPDCWRASAWYSFLAASARSRKGSPTDEDIVASFHQLQDSSSPDDVQIDLDVPRTINRHIMFRKRYRGGQRLLFRVLHALSIYFPDVGYVQGMASLAATLLCYFDEEKCFVMLVRMWQLRGLEQLYRPGFDGLLAALKDLETQWLGGKETAQKLNELCIDPTAYGTRWYLTLFNLSIPFQAQLRVWDVFMLLGDVPMERPATAPARIGGKRGITEVAGIEIIHATSAALINALGEVILDSDFENAMKALTSWIPIKDEDLLMKVAKAEYKVHQSRRKG